MLAPLATRGMGWRPVHGGSFTLRLWPRWSSGMSLFWLAAWLIIITIPPPARADGPAADRWQLPSPRMSG